MSKMLLILVVPFLAAFVSYYIGTKSERWRDVFNILTTAFVFIEIIMIYPDVANGGVEYMLPNIMGTGLHLKIDSFRYAMLFITGLAWFLCTMYSTQYLIKYKHRNRYYMFFMLTYAFTLGVFMSENILNLFTFFEGMSLASYALIIHDEDVYSHEAGVSYLAMAIAGGLVLLMGIFVAFDYTNTLEMTKMARIIPYLDDSVKYVIAGLLIFGFGIKASMFPLHTWLPKAYAAAPAPATAVLSAILLKTGLFGIILTVDQLLGQDLTVSYVIFGIGLINIILGGVLAIMQRNLKRIIAYSSMSQTGFMLLGIGLIGILGEEGGIAVLGTILYMINHAVFKLLLFMGAGVIYMIFHDVSLNKIWGFGKHKRKLKAIFLVGVLGIIGFPGFNGYTSKTLIHEAIIEAQHLTHSGFFVFAEYIFYIGGAMTVAYMLKLFIAIFMEENEAFYGQYKEQFHKRAFMPLAVLMVVIIAIGLFPNIVIHPLYAGGDILNLHLPEHLHFFSKEALLSSFKTLSLGVLLYFIVVRKTLIKREKNTLVFINPSLNWFNLEDDLYKPVFTRLYTIFIALFKFIDGWVIHSAKKMASALHYVGELESPGFTKMDWDPFMLDDKEKEDPDNGRVEASVTHGKQIAENLRTQRDGIVKSVEKQANAKSNMLKDVVVLLHSKVSSITYSVFLLGGVLIISFIFIYMKQ